MSDNYKDYKKDSSRSITLQNNGVQRFSSLISNEYQTYILRKSERLASALYVITGFIQSDEPLRIKLRASALDVITQSSNTHTLGGKSMNGFGSRCSEIGALLETAKKAGLISHMNANLIGEEYARLAEFVEEHKDKILEQEGYESAVENVRLPSPQIHKGHFVNNKTIRIQANIQSKGTLQFKGHSRRDRIIALFKNMHSISIRDAVSKIDGVSEKTVQRELLSLVDEGVLEKVGERRWSTYKLNASSPQQAADIIHEPSDVQDAAPLPEEPLEI